MQCQTGYTCVTVPKGPEGSTMTIETDGDPTPVTQLPDLAETGMDVSGIAALGLSLVAAGLIMRWNARRLRRQEPVAV